MGARRLGVAVPIFLLVSCAPDLKEGWFSCVDDQGCPDGWFCHASHLCYSFQPAAENNEALCLNGIDDDGQGGADCLDASCIDGGFCYAREVDPPCDPYGQTGCPVGMACYLLFRADSTFGTVCRRPGTGMATEACDASTLTPPDSHPCLGGLGCYFLTGQRGTCGAYCWADAECPDGALCEGEGAHAGLCTTPCNPNQTLSCPTGYACASYALLGGLTYYDGGARNICVTVESVRSATASAGETCDDPPTGGTAPNLLCRVGTVCVGDGSATGTCRSVCDLAAPTPCPSGGICHRPTEPTYVARPLYSTFGQELGYCI